MLTLDNLVFTEEEWSAVVMEKHTHTETHTHARMHACSHSHTPFCGNTDSEVTFVCVWRAAGDGDFSEHQSFSGS